MQDHTALRLSSRNHWLLEPDIAYLNHGSFGATPKAILNEQRRLQTEMEREPVQFMLRKVPELLWASQVALADFIGAQPEDVVLTDNATTAVNTVFCNIEFQQGDEIIFVNQVYGACRKTAEMYAKRTGAVCREIVLPTCVTDAQQIVDLLIEAWTPRVRLLLIDHICSPTGWILPIESVVHFYESKGTAVLVDGAHALGQIPLDLDALGASYYVANAHKWLCTPKGSAMLHVRRDRQIGFRPLVLSHWVDWENQTPKQRYSPFQMAFAWTGTRDVTAGLTIPFALKWMSGLHPEGWSGLMNENTRRSQRWRRMLCDEFNQPLLCPDSMVGHMGCLYLPASIVVSDDVNIPIGQRLSPLWAQLYSEYGIEVVVFPVEDRQCLRFSIQRYVSDEDLERLLVAIQELS